MECNRKLSCDFNKLVGNDAGNQNPLHRRCPFGEKREGQHKAVNRPALLELLIHGVKYVYPSERENLSRRIPTSISTVFFQKIASMRLSNEPVIVWPYAEGTIRGEALKPLYPSVPYAALQDEKLYELLILVDVIRDGRARERAIAQVELEKKLLHV